MYEPSRANLKIGKENMESNIELSNSRIAKARKRVAKCIGML